MDKGKTNDNPFFPEPAIIANPERTQVGGNHYTKHKIQPFDVIVDYDLDFFEASAVKYLLRYRDKNGLEDLKKAQHYVNMLVARAEGNEEWLKA